MPDRGGPRATQHCRSFAARLLPPCPPAAISARGVSAVAGALIAGTVLVLLRQGGAGAPDTLYAEDGTIFLGEALGLSTTDAVSNPYMGYLHVVPRLTAELATSVPLNLAAAVFALTSAAVLAALALVVFRASAGHIRSVVVRGVLATSVVILPAAQEEAFNNVANLHWFLMFVSAWVLLWNPRSRWERVIGAGILILSGLSDPLTIVLAPLAVLRLVAGAERSRHLFTAAFTLGVSLQLLGLVVFGAERQGLEPTLNIAKIVGWYGFYVVGRAGAGMRLLDDAAARPDQLIAGVVVLVMAIGLFVAARRNAVPPAGIAFLALSPLFYAAVVVPTGKAPPRYAVVPILLLLSAVACLVDRASPAVGRRHIMLARGALLAIVLSLWASNYRIANRRSAGPRWSDELAHVEQTCRSTPADAGVARIAPGDWFVSVPCQEVDRPRS